MKPPRTTRKAALEHISSFSEGLTGEQEIAAGGSTGSRLQIVAAIYLVVIPVIMPPGPVLLLLCGRQLIKIPVFVIMVFAGPRVVIRHLRVVPHVIVAIVGVVNPVGMMFARRAQYGRRQGGGQEKGTDEMRLALHRLVVLL
jgi:hypothetical protein